MICIYDAFEHLRRALFWKPDGPISMLTFYADDSGKKRDHEYLVVAAYIGLSAQWETFSIDWRLRLAKAGLTWFHASDFFHGSGEFEGWNKPERAGAEALMERFSQDHPAGHATRLSMSCARFRLTTRPTLNTCSQSVASTIIPLMNSENGVGLWMT
jgi:hypothetical protein